MPHAHCVQHKRYRLARKRRPAPHTHGPLALAWARQPMLAGAESASVVAAKRRFASSTSCVIGLYINQVRKSPAYPTRRTSTHAHGPGPPHKALADGRARQARPHRGAALVQPAAQPHNELLPGQAHVHALHCRCPPCRTGCLKQQQQQQPWLACSPAAARLTSSRLLLPAAVMPLLPAYPPASSSVLAAFATAPHAQDAHMSQAHAHASKLLITRGSGATPQSS